MALLRAGCLPLGLKTGTGVTVFLTFPWSGGSVWSVIQILLKMKLILLWFVINVTKKGISSANVSFVNC